MSNLISRQAAIDALTERYRDPSRTAKLEELVWAIEGVPSVEPEERTAKVRDWSEDVFGHYRCDKCGFVLGSDYVYCPNCGARLEWE